MCWIDQSVTRSYAVTTKIATIRKIWKITKDFSRDDTLTKSISEKHQNVLWYSISLDNGRTCIQVFSPDGISNSLLEIKYDSDKERTLPANVRRYETIFAKRGKQRSDKEKITLLLQNFDTVENTKYTNLILP